MHELIKANAGLLFAGVATFVLMGAGQSLYGPALPAFSRIFGVSVAEAGLLVSAHWVGCFLGVGGMFLFGARVTPRVALALMTLGAAGLSLLAGWAFTLGAAVVYGAGYGCSTAVFNPRVLRAFGAGGPSMLSLLNATFGIGAIAAPLVFVRVGNDPQLAFAMVAGLSAVVWLLAGAAGRVAPASTATQTMPFRPRYDILAFGMVAIGLEASLIGLGPTALIRAGITEVHAAELLSAFFATFLAARVVLIFTAHLFGSFTLYTGSVLGTALAALGAVWIDPGIFFVVMGAFAGLYFPGFYVTASRKMGDDLRVPPTIIAAGLVGGISAPLILAPVMEGLDERGFFWLLMVVAGGVSVLAALSWRSLNR